MELQRHDSLRELMDWWIATKVRGELPVIDFSRVQHGVAPILVVGDSPGPRPPASWYDLQERLSAE